jgi:hypothetical protein
MLDRPHKSPWIEYPDLKQRVFDMWALNLSAANIRDELAQDRIYLSRNSILGKLHRAGLLKPDSPQARRKPKVNAGGIASRLIQSLRKKTSAPLPKPPPPYLGFMGVTFENLEYRMCRYPQGESPYLFCGSPAKEGSSYCSHCHEICWRPKEPRVR